MTKLDIFKKAMTKAKYNGYTGPDGDCEIGKIINDTNVYAIIFREDFAKALWGESTSSNSSITSMEGMFKSSEFNNAIHGLPCYKKHLIRLSLYEDKWKYIEENIPN